jgi:hypothetical protein
MTNHITEWSRSIGAGGTDNIHIHVGKLALTFTLTNADRLRMIELLCGATNHQMFVLSRLFVPMLETPSDWTTIDEEMLKVRGAKP